MKKMNKETYEALKIIMETLGEKFDSDKEIENIFVADDLNKVENWIEKVKKEYNKE